MYPTQVSVNQFTGMNGSLFAPPNYPGVMHDPGAQFNNNNNNNINTNTFSTIAPTNGPRTQTTYER